MSEPSAEELRLPSALRPLRYDLRVRAFLPGFISIPHHKHFTFHATVVVKFTVAEQTDRVVLNSVNHTFGEAVLSRDGQPCGVGVRECEVQDRLEKVVFHLTAFLEHDAEYTLEIPYSGQINSSLNGFYRSAYKTSAGETRYAATTYMCPSFARSFVPCCDEPAMKAVWCVSAEHPRGSIALNNGIELGTEQIDGDWLVTRFAETMPMSSYLLALCVCDFHYSEAMSASGTRIRVYTRPEAVDQTAWALAAAKSALDFFETFYGIPFPLHKQDMIGFQDFEMGAMENWGLITYIETRLMYDPKLCSIADKIQTAKTITHEMAHQWFGNLVTMAWWDDVWLNEGFATLMEKLGTDVLSPLHRQTEEQVLETAVGLAVDARATSHPLSFIMSKARDAMEAFDRITYNKGSAVLHMMRGVMGADHFQNGVNLYLNRFAYRNAKAADLWEALSEAVPHTLRGPDGGPFDMLDFANKWILQMGYPVLSVSRVAEGVQVRQTRFKTDENAVEKDKYSNPPYGYKWDVPLFHSVNGEKRELLIVTDATVVKCDPPDVLILNDDAVGFYRVNYDALGWERIRQQLLQDHEMFSCKTRNRLIDDAFALAAAGQLDYTTAFDVCDYLPAERELLPWKAAMDAFGEVLTWMGDDHSHIKAYLGTKLRSVYDSIDWSLFDCETDDDYFASKLGAGALSLLYRLDDTQLSDRLHSMWMEYERAVSASDGQTPSSKLSRVPLPLRRLVYAEGVHRGGQGAFDLVLSLYERETEMVESRVLVAALASATQPPLVDRLLCMCVSHSSPLRQNDKLVVVTAAAAESAGARALDRLICEHWQKVEQGFGDSMDLMSGVLRAVAVTSEETLTKYEAFVSAHPSAAGYAGFSRLLESGRHAVKWQKLYRDHVNSYVSERLSQTTD